MEGWQKWASHGGRAPATCPQVLEIG